MHGMLRGRKAIHIGNAAEEEWNESGIGLQVQDVESTVSACVIQLEFGDWWKFFTAGVAGGSLHSCFESLILCMIKGTMALNIVHATENKMKKKKKYDKRLNCI